MKPEWYGDINIIPPVGAEFLYHTASSGWVKGKMLSFELVYSVDNNYLIKINIGNSDGKTINQRFLDELKPTVDMKKKAEALKQAEGKTLSEAYDLWFGENDE